MNRGTIKRALISVYDKTGLVEFARALDGYGIELLSTGGTATVLRVQDGEVLTTDGPFAEGKEHVGGFWVIKAPDLDSALAWGRKATQACRVPIEVRPFQDDPGTDA